MVCGTRSFSRISDDGHPPLKKSMSNKMGKNQRRGPNPYSSTGLDKFGEVLAELESKREKIMLRAKSQGDATVRFTYKSSSDDWIPVIIRPRPKQPKEEEETKKDRKRVSAPPSLRSVEEGLEVNKESDGKGKELVKEKGKLESGSYGWGVGCWGLVIMLVLVLLVFGRSFAVCWTAMCWYLVPMVKGWSEATMSRCLGREELVKMASVKKLWDGGVNELGSHKRYLSRRRRS